MKFEEFSVYEDNLRVSKWTLIHLIHQTDLKTLRRGAFERKSYIER